MNMIYDPLNYFQPVENTTAKPLEITQPMKQQPYPHTVQMMPMIVEPISLQDLTSKKISTTPIAKTAKVHPKIAQFIGQEVIVKMINNAFSSSGILVSATNKLIVLNTTIGHNKNHQPIKDELVIMMANVASISRNPRDME